MAWSAKDESSSYISLCLNGQISSYGTRCALLLLSQRTYEGGKTIEQPTGCLYWDSLLSYLVPTTSWVMESFPRRKDHSVPLLPRDSFWSVIFKLQALPTHYTSVTLCCNSRSRLIHRLPFLEVDSLTWSQRGTLYTARPATNVRRGLVGARKPLRCWDN